MTQFSFVLTSEFKTMLTFSNLGRSDSLPLLFPLPNCHDHIAHWTDASTATRYKCTLILHLTSSLYNKVSPKAHLTKLTPALTVSVAPATSNDGFTSTRSIATNCPDSCTHSAI